MNDSTRAAKPNGHGHPAPDRAATEVKGSGSCTEAHPWPTLDHRALPGLVGDLVAAACERSEANPAAVLGSCLVWFGACFGPGPYLMVGDTRHHPRLFCFKVGATSKARKGTSEDPVRRVFRAAEELHGSSSLRPLVVSKGPLSTGEGLVQEVRDPSEQVDEDGNPTDAGITDKRLLVIEEELGAPLKATQREGNTLSAILRMAWDAGDIRPMTKSHRIKATNAHICLIGHITRAELSQLLRTSDIWNGFANRVLWLCVRRPKLVASPAPMDDGIVAALARSVRAIIDHAGTITRVNWSEEAKQHWDLMYPSISVEDEGAFGAVTARAEAQLQRLALLYALIDRSAVIEHRHFLAATAVWDYARSSARLLFGSASADPYRNRILDLLSTGPLTQTELNDQFGGHVTGAHLRDLLEGLQASRLIVSERERTMGRSTTRWSLAASAADEAEKAEKAKTAGKNRSFSACSAYSAADSSLPLVERLDLLGREQAMAKIRMLDPTGA